MRVDLDRVVVTCAGVEWPATPGAWPPTGPSPAPDHGQIARTMRVEAAGTDTDAADDVEVRDLTVYDRATGAA